MKKYLIFFILVLNQLFAYSQRAQELLQMVDRKIWLEKSVNNSKFYSPYSFKLNFSNDTVEYEEIDDKGQISSKYEFRIKDIKQITNADEEYYNAVKISCQDIKYSFKNGKKFSSYKKNELTIKYDKNISSNMFADKLQGIFNFYYPSDAETYHITNNSTSNNDEILLPPILSIQEITFSKNQLNAGETAQLTLTLKNIGAGDANGVYVKLSSDLAGLQFATKTDFPLIAKRGGIQTAYIDVKGGFDLPTVDAIIKIEIVEPNFKVRIQGKQVKFPTREFLKPELLLAKFAVVENLSANPNNQIDINEQIDVKFAVQNIGQGNAENVDVKVTNNQTGVMLLGVVDNSGNLIRKNPTFNEIASGKYETITFRYFINSEFTSNQLSFTVASVEKYEKYGFSQTKSVEINKVLQEEGYIRKIAATSESGPIGKVVIEDIPDFVSDVDQNIPINSIVNDKTFAVIIGNEIYAKEIQVKYALNDARIFKQYLQKTLGLPNKNIHYIENATFGQILDGLKWINDVIKAYNGQAKVIFYYAGHGMPDEQTKSAYLLPVDGNSQNPATAVKLLDVYGKLTEHPSTSITLFLDACFSGAAREQNTMLADGRGVRIKPKNDLLSGNLVVFSAATGDETSFPYTEKQHGMFTYFLLKKMQDSKGNATLNDLSSFIIENVTQQSVIVNKKIQTPQVNTSIQVQNTWQAIKLR